jgi:pimeloyl-ACP methyl ester carboxylesterase
MRRIVRVLFLAAFLVLDASKESGVTVQQVTFYARKEESSKEFNARRGILSIRPGAKSIVLVMHGYTSSKVDANVLLLLFPESHVFVFDFRAHGEDTEGQCSTLGYDEVNDVFAAVDYLRNREEFKGLPIIGYGFSMGGATGIESWAKEPSLFVAGIFDCPFDRSENIVCRGLDRLKFKFLGYEFDLPGRSFLEKYAFSPYVQPILQFLFRKFARMDATLINTMIKPISPSESIKGINGPVMLIGCVADTTVPVEAVEAIYNNAPGIKRLWITDGVRHYGSIFYNPEKYKEVVNGFVKRVLSGSIKREPRQLVIARAVKEQDRWLPLAGVKIAGAF